MPVTLLYQDLRFLEHETGHHPERPARLSRIHGRLDGRGLAARCTPVKWQAASDELLALAHDSAHIAAIRAACEAGGGQIEQDTVVSGGSFDAARLAVGAACDAVHRAVAGEDRTALCLVRPPGHHALAAAPMGFCLFSNVAIAALNALEQLGLRRILIVDWDVHHGNGTQDILYRDGRIAFFSAHRHPFYPGTGAVDETGAGPGLGFTRNLPLRFGVEREDYLSRFRAALESFADHVRPELVLVSAGFDAHRLDPVGSLGLETEDFAALTQIVQAIAAAHAAGRIVSVLEGGYHLDALADSVAVHLEALLADA
jgi:acetoin utilization deacetylase AcuC-like enzyme